MNSRTRSWVEVVFFLSLAAVTGALFLSGRRSAPADERTMDGSCIDCDPTDLVFVPTGDAAGDMRTLKLLEDGFRAKQVAKANIRRLDHIKKMSVWRGTNIVPAALVSEKELPLYASLCEILSTGMPSHQARHEEFSWCLDKMSEFKVVGWHGVLSSAVRNEGGWEVKVQLRPFLMHEKYNSPYCGQECAETWRITETGDLTFVKLDSADPQFRGPATSRLAESWGDVLTFPIWAISVFTGWHRQPLFRRLSVSQRDKRNHHALFLAGLPLQAVPDTARKTLAR